MKELEVLAIGDVYNTTPSTSIPFGAINVVFILLLLLCFTAKTYFDL